MLHNTGWKAARRVEEIVRGGGRFRVVTRLCPRTIGNNSGGDGEMADGAKKKGRQAAGQRFEGRSTSRARISGGRSPLWGKVDLERLA